MDIKKVSASDIESLLPLWEDYQRFYKVKEIDREKNKSHIETIVSDQGKGLIFIGYEHGEPIGYYAMYFTYASTLATRVALLNDLFVIPEYRGKKKGKELLDHAVETTRELGITHIRWLTQEDNEQAMRLYKHYASATKWYSYLVKL